MAEYKKPTTTEELTEHFEQIKPYMNPTMAYYESSRCLYCYDAPCVKACPTSIDIPLFIRQINTDNVDGAAKTIYESNYFGNICGKVCPTEVLCEGACVYNHQEVKPIEIGRLQSFATNQAVENNKQLFELAPTNGKRVAIIGAGPAGISCACELRRLGYEVTVFEAKKQPSGLALYGVAPYKITNEAILDEVDYLQEQFDFDIKYETPIETEEQLKNLEFTYKAIFIGVGLGNTRSLNLKKENIKNSIGATEFIEQVKIKPLKTKVGKRVVVIGGGNTAMDAASEAARLGAEEVTIVYRRSKEEMGAYEFEYDLAKSVGARAIFNATPIKIYGKKRVKGIQFIKTEDVAGQLSLIEDSEFDLKCDMIIRATGQSKLKGLFKKILDLKLDKKGNIKVNRDTYQTSNSTYFAAGDAVNGGAEVVNAVAEAKIAAQAIHQWLEDGGR